MIESLYIFMQLIFVQSTQTHQYFLCFKHEKTMPSFILTLIYFPFVVVLSSKIWCFIRVLKVPDYIVKAKQVKVTISRQHISAAYTDSQSQTISLVNSDLAWPINVEESMWSLVPKDCIHVSFTL